jgi:predicted amidohydrolase
MLTVNHAREFRSRKERRLKIRIGQIKVEPVKGALDSNHSTLMGLLDEMKEDRLDVVITPECFLDGYVASDPATSSADLRRFAIDAQTSPYAQEVAQWAGTNEIWVVYGCSRLAVGGVLNSAVVYDRAGRIAMIYDKLHLTDDDVKFAPGQALTACESDFGKFGVMICADRRWPETARTLALQGARIVFNPTYGFRGDLNTCMMRTRSYENEMFIAFTHPCEALMTDPTGAVICQETATNVRFVSTDIELARQSTFSHLNYRRPDVYQM